MKKIFVIAGETSGDLQASKLMKAMNTLFSIHWGGIGGDLMAAEGLNYFFHVRQMEVIGFTEVIKNIRFFFSAIKKTKEKLLEFKADAIILIDYPGFNLKIAKYAKSKGIKVIYYITPQIWAWHKKRIFKMEKYIDEIINIFPFEVEFYKRYHIKSHYFGHPLTEGLVASQSEFDFRRENRLTENKLIGILAGSRESEVRANLPIFFEALSLFLIANPNYKLLLSVMSGLNPDLYKIPMKLKSKVTIISDKAYDIMAYSKFVIVASGTATIETACFNTPMIVCYNIGFLTRLISNQLLTIENLCLVNIVYGERVVPEFIRKKFTAKQLYTKMNEILRNKVEIKKKLKIVEKKLRKKDVSLKVAEFILSRI